MAVAKKQSKARRVEASTIKRAARIVLPDPEYRRVKGEADRFGLTVTAYARMAVMERVERDEAAKGPQRSLATA